MTTLITTPAAEQLRYVEHTIGRGVLAAGRAATALAHDVDALARRTATLFAQRAQAVTVVAYRPETAPTHATGANENRSHDVV